MVIKGSPNRCDNELNPSGRHHPKEPHWLFPLSCRSQPSTAVCEQQHPGERRAVGQKWHQNGKMWGKPRTLGTLHLLPSNTFCVQGVFPVLPLSCSVQTENVPQVQPLPKATSGTGANSAKRGEEPGLFLVNLRIPAPTMQF